jgi:hypothetical protein
MIKRTVGIAIVKAENAEPIKRNCLQENVHAKWEEARVWFDEPAQCVTGEWEIRYVVWPSGRTDKPDLSDFSEFNRVSMVILPYTEKPPNEWPSGAVMSTISYKTVSVRWSVQDENDYAVTKKIAQGIIESLDLVAIWNKSTADPFRISVGHKAAWQ